MNSRFLISLTSIPRRLDGSLLEVVAALKRQSLKCTILINIPHTYRKWGPVGSIPIGLKQIEDVVIFSPKKDYGAATKLLGALEYVQDRPEVSHIITVDDDMIFEDPDHLRYLSNFAMFFPGYAVTFGGIKLEHFPFKFDDGLTYYNRFKFVDVPAGYRGVSYPANLLRDSKLPVELSSSLPPGVFNDDDSYFGIVLSALGIPLFAIPNRHGGFQVQVSTQGNESAVAELADKERTQNEMEIFQYAVSHGYFLDPKRMLARRLSFWQRLGIASIYVKELFRRAIGRLATTLAK